MAYHEEEKTKLKRIQSREAIALALQGNWHEAININSKLVDMFPDDVEAYNRLGRAYTELGEYEEAEKAYRHSLKIDSYNAIAQKNIQRLALLKKTKTGQKGDGHKVAPQTFIEEIGKAGVVQLHNLAKPVVLAHVAAGDEVHLKSKGINLVIESLRSEYIGQVEPKYGQRIARLMNGGNKYTAAIVNSSENAVNVMIRETYQHPAQTGQLSFPTRGIEGARLDISDRVIRREIEQEENLLGDPGYTVVGGEESEVLAQEPVEDDFDDDAES
ncbi:MAG: tetratricopeptide repeat protein [Dehalococcoidales bacterium]|nr:tetratricopeptide repeat protein [Dehalococcoidales bacterium]